MSMATWRAAFYPRAPTKRMSKQAAIAHSLKKWLGLRKDARERHAVQLNGTALFGADGEKAMVIIDASTCALCVKYLEEGYRCHQCPLAQVRGGVACDVDMPHERRSPFAEFEMTGNPERMIEWLEKAKAATR